MSIPVSLEIPLAILAYSFCSGTMLLVNKMTLHKLPFPSLVTIVQLFAAILFIYTAKCSKWLEVDPIRWKFVKPYLAYTMAFSLGVYCNMKSLSVANVETVIVFRALCPVVVSVLDFIFLGRELPSKRSWAGLSLIVAGAYGYASMDDKFEALGWHAYFWPMSYMAMLAFQMTYGKKIVKSVDLKTQSGPVLYTNMLGWPPMLVFAQIGGEYQTFWDNLWLNDGAQHFPPGSIPLLIAGCIVGTGIGYSSWYCRAKVSATSFTLIGVMNKCLTVLLNLLIWDQHAKPAGIASLLLCLLGGSIYKQAPLRTSGSLPIKQLELEGANMSKPFEEDVTSPLFESRSSSISSLDVEDSKAADV